MVPCAACFNRFKMAEHHLKADKELKAKIEGVVGAKYQGGIAIRNPIDIIFNDIGIDTPGGKSREALDRVEIGFLLRLSVAQTAGNLRV